MKFQINYALDSFVKFHRVLQTYLEALIFVENYGIVLIT